MKVKCALFDLDNTLIQIPRTWIYFDTIIIDVIKEYFNVSIPTKEKRDTLWRSGKEYTHILKSWGINDPDAFWRYFDQIDEHRRKQLIKDNKLIMYSDVIPTLEYLKTKTDIILGIVTNTPQSIANYELKYFEIDHYFQQILGLGDDQSISKPEPDGIKKIMHDLHTNCSDTIYIGDSLIDIQAAIRAKVLPILIDRKDREDQILKIVNRDKFRTIKSLKELLVLFL